MTYKLKDMKNRLRLSTENPREAFAKYRKLKESGVAIRLELYESLWAQPILIYES